MRCCPSSLTPKLSCSRASQVTCFQACRWCAKKVIHAAIFITTDIVFTKNGYDFTQPWILMRKSYHCPFEIGLCSGKGGHGRLGRVETDLLSRTLPIRPQHTGETRCAPLLKSKSKRLLVSDMFEVYKARYPASTLQPIYFRKRTI